LADDLRDARVHQGDVELGLGGQLLPGHGEPPLHDRGVLGAPAGEPADQLVPGRRGQEHQLGPGHQRPDLAGALQVDLEHHGAAGSQVVEHRLARGAVEVPGELRPLEQAPALDQLGELLAAHEPVVDAVGLPRPREPGGGRDGQPHLGVLGP
jgi:hypothetical protein